MEVVIAKQEEKRKRKSLDVIVDSKYGKVGRVFL
jgi:hypothetical protein